MNYNLCRSSASQLGTAAPSLSAELRAQTSLLHRQIEALLGLPGAIRTSDEYVRGLGRFLGFYAPLEHVFKGFPEWNNLGIRLPARALSSCLANDLAALGADPASVRLAAPAQLPDLPTFAHALGALYVMEGATLGGRLILRDLEMRLGDSIAEATCFFGGRGERVGPIWQSFRETLDNFGSENPQASPEVVAGAERVFLAMLDWFAPFCAGRP
jgi:heme oxygenase (biliverdin-IX-beta and delta-forming)